MSVENEVGLEIAIETQQTGSDQQPETAAAKSKRLLTLAKRKIEDGQREIAEKDAIIEQLQRELSYAEANVARAAANSAADPDAEPVAVLRRVDHYGTIWVLVELDDEEESLMWKGFDSEAALQTYIKREGAEPIRLPPCSLSPEEGVEIREAADVKVAQIREEFRKYRVRAELIKKQKESEVRNFSTPNTVADRQRRISGNAADATAVAELKEEVAKLQAELAEQDELWRVAYEKQVREAEKLRKVGSETAIAAQWRQRYEQATRDKEDAIAKLDMAAQGGRQRSGDSGAGAHEALERRYSELQEEYKLYRKRAMELLGNQQQVGGSAAGGEHSRSGSMNMSNNHNNHANNNVVRRDNGAVRGGDEAKLAYLRNLLLKYLSTDATVAKQHMERAMTAVLEFSESELKEAKDKMKKGKAGSTSWLPGK